MKPEQLDITINNVIGFRNNKASKGSEIGIEIEVEGRNLPGAVGGYWVIHQDNSLRNGGQEYVLNRAITRSELDQALNQFAEAWRAAGAVADDSYRTSVHVHLNCRELTYRQVILNATMYGIFEDMLVQWCGPQRSGNLFCLRMIDAEYLPHTIRTSLKNERFDVLGVDQMRYGALNMKALYDHGSIEFRSMRGTVDVALIKRWVNILLAIRDASFKYNDPTEILADVSRLGPQGFTAKVFNYADAKEIFYSRKDFSERLYEGVRLVQDFAHAIPWPAKRDDVEVPPPKKKKSSVYYDDVEVHFNAAPEAARPADQFFNLDFAQARAHAELEERIRAVQNRPIGRRAVRNNEEL